MRSFLHDETGAVTVDWVVMTGAIVGLGLASAAAVRTGTGSLGQDINTALAAAHVAGATIGLLDTREVAGLRREHWGWITWGSYQGWTAVGPVQRIELVDSGHRGLHTPDGNPWIDMDAAPGNLVLTRGLADMNAGSTYTLSFNAAHHNPSAGDGLEVYFGGQLVGALTPTSTQFSNFTMNLVAGSGNGANQIEFRGTGTADAAGVALHGIEIQRPLGQ